MNILRRCLPQQMSKLFIAAFFGFFALGFILAGFTVLPIIGFLVALPFAAISIYLVKAHLNDQCELGA